MIVACTCRPGHGGRAQTKDPAGGGRVSKKQQKSRFLTYGLIVHGQWEDNLFWLSFPTAQAGGFPTNLGRSPRCAGILASSVVSSRARLESARARLFRAAFTSAWARWPHALQMNSAFLLRLDLQQ